MQSNIHGVTPCLNTTKVLVFGDITLSHDLRACTHAVYDKTGNTHLIFEYNSCKTSRLSVQEVYLILERHITLD